MRMFPPSGFTSRLRALALVFTALVVPACSAGDSGPDDEETTAADSAPVTVTGSLPADGWAKHPLTVSGPSTVSVNLDWDDAAANFNVYLYDPSGALLAYANTTTAKPEKISFHVPAAGAYSIGIKAKSGGGRYTLGTTVSPDAAMYHFTGTANATTSSWHKFSFPVKTGERVDATLDWANAASDLNVYLYDTTGKVVAFENSATAKPSKAGIVSTTTGTWVVALKCGSGTTTYSIDVKVAPPDTTQPPPPPPPPPPPAGPRFPGDPGKGKVIIGGAMADQSTGAFDRFEANLGGKRVGMARLYFSDSISWSTVDAHIAAGRLPNVSFKNGARPMADIATGKQDAWIDGIGAAVKARAPAPIWMTFFHEPEDNMATAAAAAEHRAAQRRMVTRWRAAGVTNFAYVADHYMTSWTFAGSGRDWRWWYPDWKGTTQAGTSKDNAVIADFSTGADSVVDVVGYDVYNWWEIGAADSKWHSFAAEAEWGLSRMRFLGKPSAIGEWGSMAYQQNGVVDAAKSKAWFTDAYAYMIQNDIVGAMYWNNNFDSSPWDCRLEAFDPGKVRFAAFTDLLGRSTTVKPTW